MTKSVSDADPKDNKWKKILYEDQSVADNYVDHSFLEEMQKNRKCESVTECHRH